MLPTLPENIDFSSDVLVRASQAQVDLVSERGKQPGQPMYAEGLIASGIAPEDALGYAVAISTEPDVRDRLGQAPFAVGFAVGSAICAKAEVASEAGGSNG